MQVTHSRAAGGARGKRAAGAARDVAASGASGASAASAGRKPGRSEGHRARGADTETRVSLYEEVTARIVAEMEAGRVPWVQPWGRADGASAGLPRNAKTGRSYSGINVLILWGAVIGAGYVSLSLAAPEFGPRRLYANLGRAAGEAEDRFAVIWNPAD